MAVHIGVPGCLTTMGTLARGRARSAFRGEIIFSVTSLVLIIFPVRIFLERATAPSFRPSSVPFLLLGQGQLAPPPILFHSISQRRHPGKFYLYARCFFLVSNIVHSFRAVVSPLPPYPVSVSHPFPPRITRTLHHAPSPPPPALVPLLLNPVIGSSF